MKIYELYNTIIGIFRGPIFLEKIEENFLLFILFSSEEETA